MYLSCIKLTNYRPYYRTKKITFGYDKEKNFNVIFANNAIGKSSLLNAITWAFYGKELHDQKPKENPIYNKIAKNECSEGQEFKVSVKLYLYDYNEENEKIHFNVERTEIYRIDENNEPDKQNEILKVLDFDGEIYENDQSKVDTNISKLMHNYFFFNGEQLGDYFDKNDLKEAIDKISQLNLINKVREHLEYVRTNKISSEISELDSDVKPINDEIAKLQKEYDELENDKGILSDQIKELKNQLEKIKKDLGDLEKSKKLNEEREKLEHEKSDILISKEEKEKKYNEDVMELYSIVQLYDLLENVAKIDVKNPHKNQLRNEILIELYEDILDKEVCICGSNFNNHPRCKNMIENRLNTIRLSSDEDLLPSEENELKAKSIRKIRDLLKEIGIKYDVINSLRKDLVKYEKRLNGKDGINRRLKQISEEFTEGDDTTIKTLEKSRIDTQGRISEEEDNLEKLKHKIFEKDKKLQDAIKQRDIILSNKTQLDSIKKQLTFCEDAIKIVKDLDKNLKDDILLQVRQKIYSQFIENDWSEGKFTNVTIGDDYKISLKDFLGDDIVPGDLSGGEERILALSFIIALNSISGFDLPLFIDAPLSTLDDNNSSYFLTNLHNFTSDKQIIFLFIGDFYDRNIENIIKPHLSNKIELIKKEEYITEVRDYGAEN